MQEKDRKKKKVGKKKERKIERTIIASKKLKRHVK